MIHSDRADWSTPLALIALAFIPVAAGLMRLADLAGEGPMTPENARFFAAPAPVVVHIVGVTLYSVLGAFQFSPGLRRSHPRWHRVAGRIAVFAGLCSALSGIWMALSYNIVPADNALLHALRLVFGSAMVLAIALGTRAIMRREVTSHENWMRRAYAIGLGAGTQAVIQLPPLLLFGDPTPMGRALMMGAGWVINLAVAEGLIMQASERRLAGLR